MLSNFNIRYPFHSDTKTAVEEEEIKIAELISNNHDAVWRAVQRITDALTKRTISDLDKSKLTNPSTKAQAQTEVLSYPIARILVSLVNERVVTSRYAQAEAKRSANFFETDINPNDDSEDGEPLDQDEMLAEFDLNESIRDLGDGEYEIDVGAYLPIASSAYDDDWELLSRAPRDGSIPITSDDLPEIIQVAFERRVKDGLPMSIPDALREMLEEEIEEIREVLYDLDLLVDIDAVVPELFPPCMQKLTEKVRNGEHLEHHSRVALATFLIQIGMTTDEIVEFFEVNPGFGEEQSRYQINHLRGDTGATKYSVPACSTMKSYGDCYNPNAICETISHPMGYYELTLKNADEEEKDDWRDQLHGEDEDNEDEDDKEEDGVEKSSDED